MPKEQKTQKEFSPEEFNRKVLDVVMKKPWGTAILAQADTVKIEVVRIEEKNDLMVRISGQKPGNALKLTTVRHIENFIDLARMVANNEGYLLDKLNALKNMLKEDNTNSAVVL
jgi:hypothetical protein